MARPIPVAEPVITATLFSSLRPISGMVHLLSRIPTERLVWYNESTSGEANREARQLRGLAETDVPVPLGFRDGVEGLPDLGLRAVRRA